MEEFIEKMMVKCGLDRATADKVVDFLKDNADDVGKYVAKSGLADKLPGGLGDKIGKMF
jgi:hypothetical protein